MLAFFLDAIHSNVKLSPCPAEEDLLLLFTPDDLPPAQATEQDHELAQQLRKSISRQFYEACDGVTQALLLACKWQITNESTAALTLVIHSPDKRTNWRLLRHLVTIAQGLERFTDQAQIRICAPDGASFAGSADR
jgi:hypothetical protein